jgi:hypothetical protein
MKENLIAAGQLLNKFYTVVYQETSDLNGYDRTRPPIISLIVSDCAIIYVDNQQGNLTVTAEENAHVNKKYQSTVNRKPR